MTRRPIPWLLAAGLTLAARSSLAQTGIDLTMTSLTGAPASAGVGKSFTLSNTVKTTGAVSKSFTVGLYLSTDNVITTSDTLIGSRTVASLKANASSTATTTVTVPTSLAPGTYYVGAVADSTNVIVETNETNNSIVGTQIQIVGADLTMTSLTGAPASVAAGGSFGVTNIVAAASTGGNAGAFTVGFYLSTDNVITTGDTLIGTRSVASLASGATSSATTTVTVPTSLAAGTYYIGAIADSASQVVESNEANNAITGSQILVGPDLTMTSLTGAPASVIAGSGFSVTSTVAASAGGAVGAFTIGFYLSTDNIITTTDTLIGTRGVSSLAAGGTSTAATAVAVSANLAPGNYYVGAIADSTGQVAEASETNNAIVAAAQIQVIGPDLSMTSLSSAPYSIGVGDSFSVTDTVANGSGGAAAGPFQVGYYLSTDGTITTSDILIGSRFVSAGLAAGQADTASTTITVPVGSRRGRTTSEP